MYVNPYESPRAPLRPEPNGKVIPPRRRAWPLWLLVGWTVFLFFVLPAFQVMSLDVKVCLVAASLLFVGFALPAASGIGRRIALMVTLVFLVFFNYLVITFPMTRPHRPPPPVTPSKNETAPTEEVPDHPMGIDEGRSAERTISLGETSTGRIIAIVFEEIDAATANPVTAYEVEP